MDFQLTLSYEEYSVYPRLFCHLLGAYNPSQASSLRRTEFGGGGGITDLSLEDQAPALPQAICSASHLASPSLPVLPCKKKRKKNMDECQPHSLRVIARSKEVTGVFADVMPVLGKHLRRAW